MNNYKIVQKLFLFYFHESVGQFIKYILFKNQITGNCFFSRE